MQILKNFILLLLALFLLGIAKVILRTNPILAVFILLGFALIFAGHRYFALRNKD